MDIDFDKEMVGTVAVTEKDALDLAALTAWFAANVEGFAGPISYTKFKGGQSNPTYRIDTPGASYVLRRQPFGKLLPSAHAVDREYAAMTAEVIGSKFFVMSMADGRSLWNGALPGLTPDERRAHYHALIDTMADLHLNDPQAIGMGDYGKPTDYCARQIGRWSKQYKLSETELMPEMERLIEWLPQTIPPQHGSSVVHGDYRLDNVIFHKTEARIIAVLDWELSTLGDPIADFSYLMLNWHNPADGRAGLMGLDIEALGIPSQEEAVERYVARTGFPVPPMDWYFAYNLFRLAGIMQGIKKRVIDGTASSA
ncbi:MAG: phosphotransferase family protein, partial [Sphingomonadales bacterium]